ncbi:hypothetical protein FB566_4129 [Stackebrandtia endophytica]|uniref:Uncharacterized protein n=1 Tax=Stackebrandtia endophytica TaxID=1496996 RepID=A0A543B182_9ACTN|nr:hypothetical protein [Stackebrandtia endophytica]TQL78540.1 hypothetical protein FB566_4129 [Stackebrandtia endophytica]
MTAKSTPSPGPLLTTLTVVASLVMLLPGGWAWIDPASFSVFVNWPNHEHFLHDAGAFQIAIGVGMLAALYWRDALAVTIGGFLFGNTLHTVNHIMDSDLGGGNASDPLVLGSFSVVAAVALVLRLRQLSAASDTEDA